MMPRFLLVSLTHCVRIGVCARLRGTEPYREAGENGVYMDLS